MMNRKALALFSTFFFISLLSPVYGATDLKVATLAPENSPWGQVFKTWAGSVEKDSKNDLNLIWQWGGASGDEPDMVNKLNGGTLDGAVLTSVGLNKIDIDFSAFEMPRLFPNWSKLDTARNALQTTINQKFANKGFVFLGWADVGESHFLSSNPQIKSVSDINLGTWGLIQGDPFNNAMLSAFGNPHSKIDGVPGIDADLVKSITILNATSLASEQLQWSTKMKFVNTLSTGFKIGALVLTKKAFDKLTPTQREVILKTGQVASEHLIDRIRTLDGDAYAKLRNTKTVSDPTGLTDWDAKFAACRADLRGKVISTTFYDAVTQAAK